MDNKVKWNAITQNLKEIKIDLGCGPSKRPGYIGIDILPLDGVDIVADFEKGLSFIPDNSVDEIVSFHLLEHITELDHMMREIHRILKPTGIKKIVVPHWSNPHYYSDYTHKRFFGLYTFDYFTKNGTNLKRKVPNFYNNAKFTVEYRKLRFSAYPFFIRNKFKAIFTHVFNLNVFMQELYEGFFTGIISCSEIHYHIRPDKK
jgi:predicted SAM-dependent methyltransferase